MARTIHFPMGLPGSGKTHFIKQETKTPNGDFDKWFPSDADVHKKMIDFDEYHKSYKDLKKAIIYYLNSYNFDEIYFDGLFLTKDDLNIVFEAISEYRTHCKWGEPINKIIIDYWIEDRESCLYNDKVRVAKDERKLSSELTIKNSRFDKIDTPLAIEIKKQYPKLDNIKVEVVNHDVRRVNDFELKINDKISYTEDGEPVICSESWTTGGTWCSYDGDEGLYSVDEAPETFKEFDELLEELCPNITFLQYKKLYRECCYKHDHEENDYYGGCEKTCRYVCRVNKLKRMLKEMNLLFEK